MSAEDTSCINIIKTRDDHVPVKFRYDDGKLNFVEGLNCSWAQKDKEFDSKLLRLFSTQAPKKAKLSYCLRLANRLG